MMRNVTGQKPRYQKPQRIIDMGCGLGFYVKALQERGLECHGFGFSEKLKYTADLVFNWRCLQIVFDDPKRMIPSQKHARILWKDGSRIEVEQINTMIWKRLIHTRDTEVWWASRDRAFDRWDVLPLGFRMPWHVFDLTVACIMAMSPLELEILVKQEIKKAIKYDPYESHQIKEAF